jgi:excisionase family DNA binding protein
MAHTVADCQANLISSGEGWMVSSRQRNGSRTAGQILDNLSRTTSRRWMSIMFCSAMTADTCGITFTRPYCPPITRVTSNTMTTNGRLIGAQTALVAGSSAWLLARILRSPDVRRVLTHPPVWVERGDLTDTINAIDQAAKAFETALTALERGKTATLSAGTAQSELTTREAANHLGMSQRRVQELAAALGGRRVGREWRLPEVAVREYEKQAGKRTGN